jgi:hypothetical protein
MNGEKSRRPSPHKWNGGASYSAAASVVSQYTQTDDKIRNKLPLKGMGRVHLKLTHDVQQHHLLHQLLPLTQLSAIACVQNEL